MVRSLQSIACAAPAVLSWVAACGAAWTPGGLPPPDAAHGYLCQRSFLSEEAGALVLTEALAAFPDTAGWLDYAAHAQARMLQAMGLDPLPERAPLHVLRHSLRSHHGYTVENVAIETLPGFWLTGNLYRPSGHAPPHAAVLHPHGHSPGTDGREGWKGHGRFQADEQIRAAALARMGAVSLTIDMVGYGDQTAIMGTTSHRRPQAMALQFWNGVRALDFLASLDGVDPARIGITAHSGGATQAFLLAALDRRVFAQASVAMVSAHFFGGCPCESGMPIHRSEDHFVSNPMIAAMMAPRPLLLVSVGGDWTLNTPGVEYPFVREIYRRAGAEDRLSHVHLPAEGHNYGASKRAAMYAFMARWLALDADALRDAGGHWTEKQITIEQPAVMRVFDATHPIPPGAIADPVAAFARLRDIPSAP